MSRVANVDGVTDRRRNPAALANNENRLTDLTAGTEAIAGAASRAAVSPRK
jgi:hypothetical protein